MPWLDLKKARHRTTVLSISTALITIAFFAYSYKFIVFEGGSDNYAHYFISKYSWKYPHLLLDHWGKPLFTILSSCFAQFGIRGVVLFNCIVGVITAIYTYNIASVYAKNIALLASLFLIFSPIFFVLMMSPMTEVLASCFLIIGLYLYHKEHFLIGSALLSGLILIRSEMIIMFPFLLLFLVLRSQIKAILALGIVPFIYSIIGGFYFRDFFWLYTHLPYLHPTDSYGKGSFFHYVCQFHILLGWPFLLTLISGIISTAFLLKNKPFYSNPSLMLLALICVLWIAFVAAHSYVYYSGGKASLGLLRVLAPVIPLMSITSIIGLKNIVYFISNMFLLRKIFFIHMILLFLIVLIQMIQPWIQLPIPYRYDEKEKTMVAALEWIKERNNKPARIRYFDVFVPYYLQLDPFDKEKCIEGIRNKSNPESEIADDELIIFDTRFGVHEGRISQDILLKNSHFRLINYFEPIVPQYTLNNTEYKIYIFEKKPVLPGQNFQQLDSLILSKYSRKKKLFEIQQKSLKGQDEYIGLFEELIPKSELNFWPNILHVYIQNYDSDKSVDGLDLCVSIESNESIKQFMSVSLGHILEKGYHDFYLDELNGDFIKIFIWNTTREVRECHLFDIRADLVNKTY